MICEKKVGNRHNFPVKTSQGDVVKLLVLSDQQSKSKDIQFRFKKFDV